MADDSVENSASSLSAVPASPQTSGPNSQARGTPVSAIELTIGFVVLVLWFLLFAGGILIPTEQYRDQLAPPNPSASPATQPTTKLTAVQLARDAIAILAFWTITNVGLLACLAAFLGAVGRRTRFAMIGVDGTDPDAIPNQVPLHYASAVIRGFGIYGLMMAGLLVLATDTFLAPTQGQYLRLSATISVLSFYAGYDPSIFAIVLQRVKKLMEQDSPGGRI